MSYSIMIVYILLFLILFYVYIFLLKQKIESLENKITVLFNKRVSTIPCIYEISKDVFIKHSEIFKNILHLRKLHFSEHNENKKIPEII